MCVQYLLSVWRKTKLQVLCGFPSRNYRNDQWCEAEDDLEEEHDGHDDGVDDDVDDDDVAEEQ